MVKLNDRTICIKVACLDDVLLAGDAIKFYPVLISNVMEIVGLGGGMVYYDYLCL
jgi:hypothetical protein